MHSITIFIGDQKNVSNGQVYRCQTFEEVANKFKKCRKGGKHEAYFVRGELNPANRKDRNLVSSKLIVIDADCSSIGGNAPDPSAVHDHLCKLGINHFIYTTHSHIKEEKNKYRVVVDSDEYTKEDLAITNSDILLKLRKAKLDIRHVKEMRTWSQPWFSPTREDPDDGNFEFYSKVDGKPFKRVRGAAISTYDSGKIEGTESIDIDADPFDHEARASKPYDFDYETEKTQRGSESGHEKIRQTNINSDSNPSSSNMGRKRGSGNLSFLNNGDIDESTGVHSNDSSDIIRDSKRGLTDGASKTNGSKEEASHKANGLGGSREGENSKNRRVDNTTGNSNDTDPDGCISISLEQMYENIRTGKEFHESMRDISYQLIMDGMSKAHVIAFMENLMQSSIASGTDRWQERLNDIPRTVEGAVARKDEAESDDFEIDDITEEEVKEPPLPVAPGRLGRLAEEAYLCSRYPDRKISLVTSLFAVASVCSRRFNVDIVSDKGLVDPTALNLYMTLCGPTGSGKDTMKSFTEKLLFSAVGIDSELSFLGTGEFTSKKSIYNQLKDARCQGVIAGEAGLCMQTTSGDQAGVKAMLLSIYGRGHWNGFSDGKSFSAVEDKVGKLRAACLTKLSESTESELVAGYQDKRVKESGLLPRESVFWIRVPCTEMNRDIKAYIDEEHIIKFTDMLKTCSETQAHDDPKAFFITVKSKELREEMYQFSDELRKIGMRNDGSVKSAMATRMFVKALRMAGLAVVYNKDKGNDDCLVMDEVSWKFGRSMVEYEMDTIENIFSRTGMGGASGSNDAVRKVLMVLVNVVNGNSKNKILKDYDIGLAAHKIVVLTTLKQLTKQVPELKILTEQQSKRGSLEVGFDVVIKHLVHKGAIKVEDIMVPVGINCKGSKVVKERKKRVIRCLPLFNDIANSYIEYPEGD
jgi:hypothetical protein